MNKLTIIGNLTKDPELRTTAAGVSVCDFTVAVNRRRRQDQEHPEADFFRVSAWRERGELCAKYLAKGRKVCVIGPVSVRTYTTNDGETRANMEVTAEDVEFLNSKDNRSDPESVKNPEGEANETASGGFTEVETDELPF